jgi:ribosomal protein S18 acetylase RimI-like enzyme
MQQTIRSVAPQDAAILAALIRRSFRGVAERFRLTPDNCPTHPSNCTEEWITFDLSRGKQFFLLEVGGRPAGCVAITRSDDRTGKIERLAVLPEARRHGCGSLLLEHALQALRGMGLARAELAIIAQHDDLCDWYVRRGFAVTGTREFPHLPFAAAFLSMDLCPPAGQQSLTE